ncbi:reverse transcriptase, partial [Globisporangium splendens]
MDATGTPLGPGVPETVELTIEGFPHLSSHEWMAFERMRLVLGEDVVINMLRTFSPNDQKNVAVDFVHNEVAATQKQIATPVSSARVVPLKLDVSAYKGGEREPLLRWFVELDAAIDALQLHNQHQQVAYAMSKLGGRAKSWAYGKRLADPNCFHSYDNFKTELRKAFEPPKCEFRARAEFLELRQGRMDLHEYAQRARYLVSSIVSDPIDSATQVVTFMKGLNDGPVRTQLFREYPQSMEDAINLALQEDFSIKQAKLQGFPVRQARHTPTQTSGPEPMDLSFVSTSGNERPHTDSKCLRCGKTGHFARNCKVSSLPSMSKKALERSLARGDIAQVCAIVEKIDEGFVNTASSADAGVLDEKAPKERFEEQSWDALKTNPVYELVKEYEDIFPDKVPDELPFDRGVRHEIEMLPGAKYCITRQWPLPREQVVAIDEFFAQRAKAGHVRESKSPHCSPTFCVKKATGGWRIVHAFNKLNDATIPAQTPVPRKDMILDGMVGSTVFSAIDLKDGFYQIRMREDDVPLTAVSTPSGMLWEWLVMPQGLKNAPATFNRMVTNVPRPLRTFAPSYFDDIFVHSKATNGKSDVDVHLDHLRQVFQVMRENKLYANLKKCMFFSPEIPVLGCFVGKSGVRVDPEKVKAIDDWPVPQNVKQLRQWLGLANYLHKYTRNYAALVQPLTQLLKKDIEWEWSSDHQAAFEEVKRSVRARCSQQSLKHDTHACARGSNPDLEGGRKT